VLPLSLLLSSLAILLSQHKTHLFESHQHNNDNDNSTGDNNNSNFNNETLASNVFHSLE
jgi:hypothetical protein